MTERKLKEITSMDEDFAQWYTDVVLKAGLCDYTGVKGCMVIKPYGYAIWENIQQELNRRFKAIGVENVAMPMFIPESLLNKEKEHVEGFAPEVAWVTHGGSAELEERLCVRPTSETLFCDFYSREIRSWRDLPKLYNQWCSVVRWEKTTRPFLRSREFLWQEGHTAHATKEEAEQFARNMLDVYGDFLEEFLAIPVIRGQKTAAELENTLSQRFRVWVDRTEHTPGYKFSEQEMKGIPLRIEIGKRDLEKQTAVLVRRDNGQKSEVPLSELTERCNAALDAIQAGLRKRAEERMTEMTSTAHDFKELTKLAKKQGLIRAMWCGCRQCEERLKEKTELTSRCIPFEGEEVGTTCAICGKPAKKLVLWGKAY